MGTAVCADEVEMPLLDFGDPEIAANPHAAARRLAQENWVARTPTGYIFLRWDDCKEISRDPRLRTPEGLGLGAQGITEGVAYEWAKGTILGLDGEDHARIRRLAQPGFTPQNLEKLRPDAAELIQEIVAPSLAVGKGEAAEMCKAFSVRMICRLLRWPDEDWRKVMAWADSATRVVNVSLSKGELGQIEEALTEMRAYTLEQLELLRGRRGDDIGSAILAAGEEGDRLSSVELVQLFETLLVGGSDTTMTTLLLALLVFSEHQDQWDELAADPELAPAAVEEVLRFRPILLGTGRVVREDLVYRDVEFPAGTFIMPSPAAANYDLDVYDDPFTFDIRRYADGEKRVPKPNHLTFGFGAHVCIGNYLARLELQEALKYLPGRLRNFRIDDSDPQGIEWSPPFGVHGPTWLPITWDPAPAESLA